jgi:hypothetical protein
VHGPLIRIAREQKSVVLENARKEPSQNIAGKKRARQKELDPKYLLVNAKREMLTQNKIAWPSITLQNSVPTRFKVNTTRLCPYSK